MSTSLPPGAGGSARVPLRHLLSLLALVGLLAVAGLAWTWRAPEAPTHARAGYVDDPPYMYDGPDGRPRGVSVDVVAEAARRSGIALTWVRVPRPGNADTALRSGLVDLWPGLTILPERQQTIAFSDPWLRIDLWIVRRDGGALPDRSYAARIGMTPHPVNHILIGRHFPSASRVDYVDARHMIEALCAGQVDAALMSAVDLTSAQSDTHPTCRDANLRPYVIEGSQLRLGVAARPAHAATARRLRVAIDEMAADRVLDALVVPHSVYAASHVRAVYELLHARERTRYLAYGAAALAVGLIFTVLFATLIYRADQRAKRSLREKVQLETQLHAAQRLEVLGQLAGGIAHDFNNLATIIVGYSALVQHDATCSPRVSEALREIRRAGDRAADLVRQLRTFSRRELVEPRRVAVQQQVQEMAPMLRRVLREDVTLTLDLAASPDVIVIDEGQLSRVLLNLVINAADAMAGGGAIAIRTVTESGPDGRPAVLRLSVVDTGIGMSPDVQAHVFEPFFTTKAPGQGTGLGLSTVHGVVTQAGGGISIASQPGAGTCVDLRFPLAVDEATPAGPAEAPVAVSARRGRILVVEDTHELRELVGSVLRAAGFDVLEAEDGETGLERLRAARGTLVLVLTDLVMPRLSGQRLWQAARAERCEVPFLFMSGYTDEAVPPPSAGGAPLLHKPFTPDQLLRAVGDAIERGADVAQPARPLTPA